MRRDDYVALREQNIRDTSRMREMLTASEREGRDFTGAESTEFDRLESEVRTRQLQLGEPNGQRQPLEWNSTTSRGDLAAAFRSKGWPEDAAELSWEEYRTVVWTGSVDALDPLTRVGGGLGFDMRYAYPAFPSVSVDSDITSVQVLRQSARTLPAAATVVRAIDAVTAKPVVDTTAEVLAVPMKQVAAISTNVPNIIAEQTVFDSAIRNDLQLTLNEGLDKLVLDATVASGFQAPGTDPLLISVRKAMSTVMGNGYSPSHVILRPADAEALDTLRATATAGEQYYVFAPAQLAPRNLFGLEVRISKTAAAPIVVDADAFGRMYASTVRLARFEADSGTTNRQNIRMELNAAFGVERQNAAVRIAAA